MKKLFFTLLFILLLATPARALNGDVPHAEAAVTAGSVE